MASTVKEVMKRSYKHDPNKEPVRVNVNGKYSHTFKLPSLMEARKKGK